MREFLNFLKCVLWHRGHEYLWIEKWKDILVRTCLRCGYESEVSAVRRIQAKVGSTYFEKEGT